MKRITLFFVFLLIVSPFFNRLTAQEEDINEKSIFIEAESYFLYEEYRDAIDLYLKLHQIDPTNDNINYKIGRCFLDDPFRKERSIIYLEKAVKNINPAANPSSFKEKQAPPDALFYLGKAFLTNDQISKAKSCFIEFKEKYNTGQYDIAYVDHQIQACDNAMQNKEHPIYVQTRNIGEPINSNFTESNPVLSGDGKSLIFIRKLQFYDAVFYSTLDKKGAWSEPRNIIPELGVDDDAYPTALNFDGTELYVYRNDNYDGNIYISKLVNGEWAALKKLGFNVNTKYWEAHACVSKDGKTLYFTSNKKTGEDLDIYYSTRENTNADWSPALEIGGGINTSFHENTPFITEDDKILFFSSMGHNSMGGYDVFYAEHTGKTSWSQPVNLGFPLNTTDDELFYCPADVGKAGIISRFYPDNSLGQFDIYVMDVYYAKNPRKFVIAGTITVLNKELIDYTDLKLTLYDKNQNIVAQTTGLNKDGSFDMEANNGDYTLQIEGDNIETFNQNVSLPIDNPASSIIINPTLVAAAVIASNIDQTNGITEILPELSLTQRYFEVEPGEKVLIPMKIEKGATLNVLIYSGDTLFKEENIEMLKNKYTYEYLPEKPLTTIKLTATNEHGSSPTEDIIIAVKSTENPEISSFSTEEADTSIEGTLKILAILANDSIKDGVVNINPTALNITNAQGVFNYLEQDSNKVKYAYSFKDVDQLKLDYLNYLGVDYLGYKLENTGPAFLGIQLKGFDLIDKDIRTTTDLLNYLGNGANGLDNLMASIYSIAKTNDSKNENYLEQLTNSAPLDIKPLVDILVSNINNNQGYAQFKTDLLKYQKDNNIPDPDFKVQLEKLAQLVMLNDVYNNLMITGDSAIKTILKDLDLRKNNITTVEQLMQYLFDQYLKGNISYYELVKALRRLRDLMGDIKPIDWEGEINGHGKLAQIIIIGCLGILLLTGILFLIIFFLRKKKKKEEEEEKLKQEQL